MKFEPNTDVVEVIEPIDDNKADNEEFKVEQKASNGPITRKREKKAQRK